MLEFGNARGGLGQSTQGSGQQAQAVVDSFADDYEARIGTNPVASWMDKRSRAQQATEILAAQAAVSDATAASTGTNSMVRLPQLSAPSEQSVISAGGSYDFQTYATQSDGTQQITRHMRLGVDDYLGFAQDSVNGYFNKMDDVASAAGSSTGARIFAASTYGVRKIAGDTVSGVIGLPRFITSNSMLPGIVNAAMNPQRTFNGMVQQFGSLSFQDKLVTVLEVGLGFKGSIDNLAGRIPQAGGYLAADLGHTSGQGVTLSTNGKLYGFIGDGVANQGPYAYQKGAVGGLKFGEINPGPVFSADSPYVHRYDPASPGRPDPRFSLDSTTFENPAGYNAKGFPRDAGEFWKQWSGKNPNSLSESNQYLINNYDRLKVSPRVDSTWVDSFPEHGNYMGDVLIHHHVDFGRYTIPVPGKTHVGSGGPWHF